MTDATPRLTGDEALAALRDLAAQGLDEEQVSRALLDLTLQAAGPDLADAVRLCALPAWFDADHLALLRQQPSPPSGGEPEGGRLPTSSPKSPTSPSSCPASAAVTPTTRPPAPACWTGGASRKTARATPTWPSAWPTFTWPWPRSRTHRLKGPDYRAALIALDAA